jgi:putative membrane protein
MPGDPGDETRSDRRYVHRGRLPVPLCFSTLKIAAQIAVGVVAAIHVYILVLETFLWRTDRARAAFGTTREFAEASAPLAANQGLYNGFLAAGLAYGLIADGRPFEIFFLCCVIVAAVYGTVTATRRILFVQVIPGAIALALVLLT